ncbi:gamma-glutamyltransferase [Roseomonas sp. CCTCC AB2023176]|uniref:gamma-glutamyltransferase n=1 Tax=Roseomonas sp. CCTCC AB2023176 TaxID=3342640 RepID=UPI0035E1CF5A
MQRGWTARVRGGGMARRTALAASAVLLAGCSSLSSVVSGGTQAQPGQRGYVTGFVGYVVAEEPRAAVVGRDMLSAGGSAADAAAAAAFALSVTLPSRAGIGGGGACLAYNPRRNETEAFVFLPGARSGVPAGADRPAAVPLMARGLFALHARQGRRPFEETIAPAEALARFGTTVSRALAEDLSAVSGPLMADPGARAVFAPGGQVPGVGQNLVQPDLATTLAAMRTAGVGDLHQGGLARRLEAASAIAGGALTVPELRAALPQAVAPVSERLGSDVLYTPPLAVDGGATLAAFRAAANGQAPGAVGGTVPASTALVAQDRDGGAVTCAFTMNNLFGTGRVAPGMGFLLAAAPNIGAVTPPPLGMLLVANAPTSQMRYAGAGSGQGAAPAAAGGPAGLHLVRRASLPDAVVAGAPEPGRAVAISCSGIGANTCAAIADPRGTGLASGGN